MIETSIQPSAAPSTDSPRRVARTLKKHIENGAALNVVGNLKSDPHAMLAFGYTPRFSFELFGTTFFLCRSRQIPELRYMVAYVMPRGGRQIFARIFYKDLSLIWRVASHVVAKDGDLWIGKGAVAIVRDGDYEHLESIESTTDLPYEMQAALEQFNRAPGRIVQDEEALYRVLRNAKRGRIEPFNDFIGPRKRAAANPKNLINGGKSIARFRKRNDPESLTFTPGFEPDFDGGVIEVSASSSAMYHGAVRRFRVLSKNTKVQYMFMAGSKHTWIIPPQTLTTELSTFGVRTIDVVAHDDLFVPGYEYHHIGEDVPDDEAFSQIPPGYAGAPSTYSEDRADASAWLNALPVIQSFRRKVLRRR